MSFSASAAVKAAAAAAATAEAAAAATTFAAAATAAGTAATAAFALLSFVDLNGASIELLAVHALHGVHRIFRIGKRDETEPAGAVGLTILDHLGLNHFTELLKRTPEPLVGGVPAQTSYEQFLGHDTFSFKRSRDALGSQSDQTLSDENLPHHRTLPASIAHTRMGIHRSFPQGNSGHSGPSGGKRRAWGSRPA
jgi:hypothetical protein